MRIQPIQYKYQYRSPIFGVNLSSSKLKFKKKDFFVRIGGYGKNYCWAEKVREVAENAVNIILNNTLAENVLKFIATGVREANQIPRDELKNTLSGLLRTKRDGWQNQAGVTDFHFGTLYTRYNNSKFCRYRNYAKRLDETVGRPLPNPYKKFMLSRPIHDEYGKHIQHANARYIPVMFEKIEEIYSKLHSQYILKEAHKNDLDNISALIAEIRWILAHATPWERGSDAISNVFMRSLYKSTGTKTYLLKKGVSLDLEAYCTPLDIYKKNFPNYFKKPPKIIE